MTLPTRFSWRVLNPALSVLASLALLLSPSAHAKTYVAVLKSPTAAYDHAQIVNPDGVFGIDAPGFGAYVDQAFVTAQRISDTELSLLFGPALEAMKTVLAAGLPDLSHSYVALLEHKEGPLGYMRVQLNNRTVTLDEPSEGVHTDGYSQAPFKLSAGQIAADFGTVLTNLSETRAASVTLKTYLVLLESPDGTVGKVIITDDRGVLLIDQAGQAVNLETGTAPLEAFKADVGQLNEDFGEAIKARPPLPTRFTLFFKSGKTQLTDESQPTLEKLLDDLRNRPAPNIMIEGHTDTVGRDMLNDRLSLARADYVAKQLRDLGAAAIQMEILAMGEHSLLVPTPDNTPEVRNRRVEVHVW